MSVCYAEISSRAKNDGLAIPRQFRALGRKQPWAKYHRTEPDPRFALMQSLSRVNALAVVGRRLADYPLEDTIEVGQ
jgi:hypothetical protein